jgi:hypothetical protein
MENDKKINNSLKFEIESFTNECQSIYKKMIDDNIKKCYQELFSKIETDIKNNIMQKIGSNDLFDHSDVKDRDADSLKVSLLNLNNNFGNYERQRENQNKICEFFEFQKNEKIIINNKCRNYPSSSYYMFYTVVTNFGKLLGIITSDNNNHIVFLFNENFNILLPKDYIYILQNVIQGNTCLDKNTTGEKDILKNSDYPYVKIKSVLNYIKDFMYDRKLVPLYVKDIVEENKILHITALIFYHT